LNVKFHSFFFCFSFFYRKYEYSSILLLKIALKLSFGETEKSRHDFIIMSRFSRQWAWFSRCSIVARFWEIVTRFSACWTRFENKVGRTLGRTHQSWHDLDNRDTILPVADWYISFSLHFWRCGFEGENLEYKGGNFRVECLCREVLLYWKYCNHLGEWKSLSVLFIGEVGKNG